ncbi:hypothetical protein ACOSQ3_024137 [Xanthoceras sorbifolium]
MDMWVVAATAAAGYMAKYWQNLSRDRDSSLEVASKDSNPEKPEPSCPFRRLARRKKLDKDVSTDRRKILDQRYADTCELDGVSAAEVASASGYEGDIRGSFANSDSCNVLSISSLPPEFLPSDNLKGNEFGNGYSGDSSDNPYAGEMSSFYVSARKRSSLRTKNLYQHSVKPLTSLESCLVAQLYQKHSEMEEYVLSSLPSPSTPTLRPLFVTDGSRIISKASGEFLSARIRIDNGKLHNEAYLENNEIVLGVPPLPKVGSLDLPKKMKSKSGKGRCGRLSGSSKFGDGSYLRLQGSQDVTVLFCLGISVGIISSCIANKREVDKLKEYLKQTENLVQDLQEELEMKDSMTVKELANENYGSQDTCENSFHDSEPNRFFPAKNVDNSRKHHDEEICDEKADSDSMSKIEAELEAELERMGLNINSSSLERRLSDYVELDPDFVADFTKGDLRHGMLDKPTVDQPESNKDASGTSKTLSGNYAVSPRELSLRLHEVIQSRLEERVMELEAALENSHRKLQLLESKHKHSWRKFSSSELIYSSVEESPMAKEEYNSMAEPLVMNLSGEALDAYNEAYEELMKINESDEEDSPSGVHENNHQLGFHPFDRSVSQGQNRKLNGSLPHLSPNEEKTWKEFYSSQGKTSEHSVRVEELLDVGVSGEENSDCDDEMEKQLIKQIVEKTKKGSPAVLNAQRVLFLMNEDK